MDIYLEIFGYIGTALVILSMMMTSVTKLRIINISGSIISAIYAFISNTWPIVIMNLCLIIINLFHLIKDFSQKNKFGHIKLDKYDKNVNYFLTYYKDDIDKFYPNYKLDFHDTTEIHMIYIGCEIVGILVGTRISDVFRIEMDYSIKKYRDIAVDKFLFPKLYEEGINMLTAKKTSQAHDKYLMKIGFKDDNGILIKELNKNN